MVFASVMQNARLFLCYFHRKDRVLQHAKKGDTVFAPTLGVLKSVKKEIRQSEKLNQRQKDYLLHGLKDDDEHFKGAPVLGVEEVDALDGLDEESEESDKDNAEEGEGHILAREANNPSVFD